MGLIWRGGPTKADRIAVLLSVAIADAAAVRSRIEAILLSYLFIASRLCEAGPQKSTTYSFLMVPAWIRK
jgi:hypothetical protein